MCNALCKGDVSVEKQYKISDLPKSLGITASLPLDYSPLLKKKYRVNILALGDVGTTMLIGLRLLGWDVISSIGICDINTKNLERLQLEINQIRYPFADWQDSSMPQLPAVHIVAEDKLFDCDVFIFCASKGVPPLGAQGDVRMAQLAANRSLVAHFAQLAKKAAYKGLICEVADPVDPLAKAFFLDAGLKPSQVQGYGLGVMNARACYYAEQDPALLHYLTEGRAFGPHGEDLVIADSLRNYNDSYSCQLTDLTVHANVAVRDLGYKPYIAPAMSSAAISILLTLRGAWHYGSVYIGNENKGAYFGVRNKLTTQGIVYEDAEVCEKLFQRLEHAYVNLGKLI